MNAFTPTEPVVAIVNGVGITERIYARLMKADADKMKKFDFRPNTFQAGQGLVGRQRAALKAMAGRMTSVDVSRIIGDRPSSVSHAMGALKDKGYLKKVGKSGDCILWVRTDYGCKTARQLKLEDGE